MATVLRVRRKRTNDPVESLVFACSKKARALDGTATAGDGGGGGGGVIAAAGKNAEDELKKVFKFAGTVGKKDEPISSQIEEAIKKASQKPAPAPAKPAAAPSKPSSKSSSKSKSKAKSKSRSREKSRSSQQRTAQARRYQVLSSHRGVDLAELDAAAPQAEMPKKTAPVKRTPSKLKLWNRLKKAAPAAAEAPTEEEEAKKLFCLYDIVQEDGMTNGQSQSGCTSPDRKAPIANPDVILCNSVQMVREKLVIEEGAKETDYVYDLYYIEEGQVDLNGALDGSPDQEVLLECLMPDTEEIEEAYEDDSDSNDEGNWRNDYPEDEPDKRHPDLFDELIDDYCYGDQSSDEDFGQYSEVKKRSGNKMLNYNAYGGSDDDLGCYS